MSEKELIPNDIVIEANQYGIEPSKAANLIGNLPQITTDRDAMSAQYNEIIRMDIEDPSTSKLARELRIKIKDNRTKGIAVWHKTTKDYFLKGGQFVDAIKRKEEEVNVRMEESLEQIEKYMEIKKAKEKEQLKAFRISDISEYKEFVPFSLDLSDLSEEEYAKVFNGAKLQYQAKIEQEKKDKEAKAEVERIEKIRLENERIQAEENKKRLKEAEDKLSEERKLAEQERLKIEAKLKKEMEEKKKIEEEMKKRMQEEARIKKEKEDEERRLKNASDKEILLIISKNIDEFSKSLPLVNGKEGKEIVAETIAYLSKLSSNVKQQAELLTK